MKLLLCHTDYRLYWRARISALREFLRDKGIDMKVVEIAGRGSPYAFAPDSSTCDPDGWQVLFPREAMESISAGCASRAVFKALEGWSPDVVMTGPIAFPSGAAAVRWARFCNKPVIVAEDARLADVPRSRLVNWVKRRIYANVDALFLPAPSHIRDYEFWGVVRERMFFGVNTVDNDFFAERAAQARADAEPLRRKHSLPRKFLLGVGRQIPKKNWRKFLDAWRLFKGRCPGSSLQLVLVGNGPERGKLESAVRDMGLHDVQLRDFAGQERVAEFYGLAHGLVLPSHHGETWGLVVNEAMASGLPVLVSRDCGCATTLVEDGINGWSFSPDAVEEMTVFLTKLDDLSGEQWARMGRRSQEIIADWGLKRFCQGVWDAICWVQNTPVRQPTMMDRAILRLWKGRYRPT